MREILRQLTPPEWDEWNVWGRLAYAVVLVGGMSAVYAFAKWLFY